jgi:hypothetical protein
MAPNVMFRKYNKFLTNTCFHHDVGGGVLFNNEGIYCIQSRVQISEITHYLLNSRPTLFSYFPRKNSACFKMQIKT